MLKIVEATADRMPLVHELFLEYAASLDFDLGFQGFQEELSALPGTYSAPHGCILFTSQNSELAGCIALRSLNNSISEMKRFYVRGKYQGLGIGRALATALIERARQYGYHFQSYFLSLTRILGSCAPARRNIA